MADPPCHGSWLTGRAPGKLRYHGPMATNPMREPETLGLIVHTDEDIRSGKLRQLWRYWQSLHKGETLPSRRDIDPLHIPLLLPHVMLVEALPGEADFRYRLVGTHVARIHGVDNTGKCVSECFGARECEQVIVLYQRTVREGSVIVHRGRPRRRDDRVLDYEIVHMPLADGGGRVSMILAGLEFTFDR
jgi:hypothetical protein